MKVKKKEFKTYKLDAGIFDVTAYAVISEDLDRVAEFVAFKHDQGDTKELKEGLESARGMFFHHPTYCPIVWLPSKPKTPREIATMSHELAHLTSWVCRWAHIEHCEKTEETFCHLLSHLTNQLLEKLNLHNNK